MTVLDGKQRTAATARADSLVAWAEASGQYRDKGNVGGDLCFVFYGRVSTEDWQDPVASRARQWGAGGGTCPRARPRRGWVLR
jgi:hypothetical protein